MPSPATEPRTRPRWPWIVALLAAIPAGLTLAGIVTSPPRLAHVPVGRIVYMEADEPSDHTTLLRGLRVTMPDGGSRELLHETEPQDTDSGSREWITQPKASPDGAWLAYEKQIITLQEEKQEIAYQLWTLPLNMPQAKPRLLLDLTRAHLKQFVGLAWTPDSKQIVFLNDARACLVSLSDSKLTFYLLRSQRLPPPSTVSFSRLPLVFPNKITDGYSHEPDGGHGMSALSPDRTHVAYTIISKDNPLGNGTIVMTSIVSAQPNTTIRAHWGWSVFGRREITSLTWSPDGKYVGYTVSKPPFEDELFCIDTHTRKCFQLPIRTGRAAWDWIR